MKERLTASELSIRKLIEAQNKKIELFKKELEILLNKYSLDNDCNTPDFILAEYLIGCLGVIKVTVAHKNLYECKQES